METNLTTEHSARTFGLLLVALLGSVTQCLYLLHGTLLDVQQLFKPAAEGGDVTAAALRAVLDRRARAMWQEQCDMPDVMAALRRIIAAYACVSIPLQPGQAAPAEEGAA